MKIYIASPLFTDEEKLLIDRVVALLRKNNFEVYSPKDFHVKDAWSYNNATWGRIVFEEDVKAIQECDCVICLYWGLYSDTGTAWECGYAYGIGKPYYNIFVTPDDCSLMVACGANGSVENTSSELSRLLKVIKTFDIISDIKRNIT